ncbi:MAG: hypothetical protein PUK54_06940 [Firmicutes bacterium]|nr:hypothetical protein [Bacillota bacterium]MDY5855608.1 hypothetical protein [Anaerovoracaceae bacterium]
MAYDKVIDSSALDANIASIAEAIRTKGGTTDQLVFPDGFISAIEAIETGGDIKIAYGSVTLSEDLDSITINHGLEDYPTFAILLQTGVNINYSILFNAMYYSTTLPSASSYHWFNKVAYTTSSSSSGRRLLAYNDSSYPTENFGNGYYCCHPSVNEITFNKGSCNAFASGLTYIWIALSGVDFLS